MPKKKVSRRTGRPPISGERLDDKMLIECMAPQKKSWKRAAEKAGKSLSAWVREVLDIAAKK